MWISGVFPRSVSWRLTPSVLISLHWPSHSSNCLPSEPSTLTFMDSLLMWEYTLTITGFLLLENVSLKLCKTSIIYHQRITGFLKIKVGMAVILLISFYQSLVKVMQDAMLIQRSTRKSKIWMHPVIFPVHVKYFHNIHPISSSTNIYLTVIIWQALLDEKDPKVNKTMSLVSGSFLNILHLIF